MIVEWAKFFIRARKSIQTMYLCHSCYDSFQEWVIEGKPITGWDEES